jgi:predicted metal-dependent HD superfamily phosphohydrolase
LDHRATDRVDEMSAGRFDDVPAAWTEGCSPPLFEAAYEAYQSPGRFYHTWAHVLDCVAKLRGFPCDSPRVAFLALVFHDAVYAAGNPDNEKLSAELAMRALRAHSSLDGGSIQEVARIILATRDHRAPDGERIANVLAVLDIDMSILGAPAAAYDDYVAGIRAEYVPVIGEDDFIAGRRAFLEGIAARPSIFQTGEGARRWERAARANLARELEALPG